MTLPGWYVFYFVQLILKFVWQCIVFATCKLIISIAVVVDFLGILCSSFDLFYSSYIKMYINRPVATGVNRFSSVFPN